MTTKAELEKRVKALNKARILQGEQCGHLRSWIHEMRRALKEASGIIENEWPSEHHIGQCAIKYRLLLKRLAEEL